MRKIIFILAISLFAAHQAYAGAAVAQQQQMKAMQEQAYAQAVQQAMAERQQAEVQAYQQAVAEYQVAQYQAAQFKAAQEYMVAQQVQLQIARQVAQRVHAQQMDRAQMEMLQQVVQQRVVQQVAAQIQANQVAQVQEVMVAQAIQEAIVKLGMQAYVNEAVQQKMVAATVLATKQATAVGQVQQVQAAKDFVKNEQMQSAITQRVDQFYGNAQTTISKDMLRQTVENVLTRNIAKRIAEGGGVEVSASMVDLSVREAANLLGIQTVLSVPKTDNYEPALGNDVVDIVAIEDLWRKLDQNSMAWNLLIDEQAKVMTVNEYIERYRKKKIRISKSPQYYAKMIEDMSMQNPKLLENPFMAIIQILAVMEYDFDYGGDRDELARKMLGPMYESNKQRLSSGR